MEQNKEEFKKINLQLISKDSVSIQSFCKGMAINQDNSLFMIDSLYLLVIYTFKNGTIKKLQVLQSNHYIFVPSKFLNKKPLFISCVLNSLSLWSTFLIGSKKYMKKLQRHASIISCIALYPKNENLFISGSLNGEIIVWSTSFIKKPCQQSILVNIGQIQQIIINEDGDKLIALGDNRRIIVLENYENNWKIKQHLDLDYELKKVCLINNDTFVLNSRRVASFYQNQLCQLQAYSLKDEKMLSCYPESLVINNCVSIHQGKHFYNQNNQFIFVVGIFHVYIIKFQDIENGKLTIEQIINYRNLINGSNMNFSEMSADGKYLIVFDMILFQITILEVKDL